MTVLRFGEGGPPVEGPAQVTVEIGWEHTVDDDGNLTYTRDEAGDPVRRSYTLPARLSPKATFEALARLTPELVEQAQTNGWIGFVDVVDAIVGGGIVESVFTDQTVKPPEFADFISDVVTRFKLDELLGDPEAQLGN